MQVALSLCRSVSEVHLVAAVVLGPGRPVCGEGGSESSYERHVNLRPPPPPSSLRRCRLGTLMNDHLIWLNAR